MVSKEKFQKTISSVMEQNIISRRLFLGFWGKKKSFLSKPREYNGWKMKRTLAIVTVHVYIVVELVDVLRIAL